MMVVSTHKPTIELLKELEGFFPTATYDSNRYRIGYGCELWDDGNYVKAGQTITRERAEKVLIYNMKVKEQKLNALLTNESKLNAYQKGALLSYLFNRGEGKFQSSQLRVMVNKNPNDSKIPNQFLIEWGTNEKAKNGLITRRGKEAKYYQTKVSATGNSTASTPTFLDVSILLSFLYLGYKFLKSYAT